MLSSRAYIGAVLVVAVLITCPLPLSGQYIVGQGLIRETSSFSEAYPQTPPIQASPESSPESSANSALESSPESFAESALESSPEVSIAHVAASTPSAAKKGTSISNVLVMNTVDNSTSADTALYAVLHIEGASGVTPFGYTNQKVLLNGLGQVISYVNFSDISVMDVNPVYETARRRALLEASEEQLFDVHSTAATRRRSLLATALENQADVTVEMNAASNEAAQQALTELTDAIGDSTASTLVEYFNTSGYGWSVALKSYTLTTPGSVNATVKTECHDKFGRWCLDKYKHLSSQGLKGVIAGGVIGVIAVLAALLLLRDLLAARRNKGNEVIYDPRTPNLGSTPAGAKAGAGALTLNATAGGASPNGRATPTSAGYTGGLAPVGQKVRRMSGAFTSGAVTHPASLAAAGKPTGLEGVVTPVGSPSSAGAAHHHGHMV